MLQTSAKPLPPLQGTFPASGDGIFIASAKLPLLWGLVHHDRAPAMLPPFRGKWSDSTDRGKKGHQYKGEALRYNLWLW